MLSPNDLSVIICTKDRPWFLRMTLLGLAAQSVRPGEVVVADAGANSADETLTRIERDTGLRTVRVARHTPEFQAAATRNAGAAAASGKWLLFLDDDCLPLANVVGTHLRKAADPRRWLVGGFVRLDPARTREVTPERIAAGDLARLILPKELADLHRRHRKGRFYDLIRHPKRPSIRTGQFSISAAAFRAVNGCDEGFVGWGGEDDDIRDRLIRWGARGTSLLGSAVCLHLWHEPHATKPARWREGDNVQYLLSTGRPIRCAVGLAEFEARRRE